VVEKLTIHNFGPIKSANIDMGDLTIFVGPQATGKSLTAQILYFFRRLEDLVDSIDSDKKVFEDQTGELRGSLEWWFGTDISIYSNKDTYLGWQHPDYTDGIQEIRLRNGAIEANDTLLERASISYPAQQPDVYIPSGRVLFAFVPPYEIAYKSIGRGRRRLFSLDEDWPGYISTFYRTLGRTLKWLNENSEKLTKSAETKFLHQRIRDIFKGNLQYGVHTVSIKIGNKTISPTTMAGGQLEIWPFWAIIEGALNSETLKPDRIYFDEPEAHLHPSAQRAVVEMIAYLVNQGIQFVLATHSPYILYTINLLLQAHKVQIAGRELPDDIPPEAILSPERVAAYRFSADGTIHNIKDIETNLIDEDELDRVADDLGATFTKLLEG
jgi:hypothetical protein